MTLAPGTRLGPYEISAQIGKGGMGEVYRATDTNLRRSVAIKVLPATVSSDPERLARFRREAELLASLNHPNIAAIYGLERADSHTALVMELVDGATLAERIGAAPHGLPLEDALPIARQIADALEAAHERGVIHRDLKPANIKVRPDGTVKVLDFGLAKALDATAGGAGFSPPGAGPAEAGPSASTLPTVTSPAVTELGVILGTAAYMSPEQAKGRQADTRSDIWSFGVVLFEMLTGRLLFTGESTTDVLGAVLREPVDLAALPATTPDAVRRLLRRCLERDPKRRLRDVGDARLDLADAVDPPADAAGGTPRPSRASRSVMLAGWAAAGVAIVAAGLWGSFGRDTATAPRPAYHFTVPRLPSGSDVPAISPDGRHLAYATSGGLRLRALDQTDLREFPGTDGAREPFWSPDSRSIAFFADGALKRVAIDGGPAATLASVPSGWPIGTWSSNGTILVEVTENQESEGWYVLDPGASSLRKIRAFASDRPINPDKAFPSFLPDGEHFLFTHPVGEVATLQVGSIRSDETRTLMPSDSRAHFVPPGFVLYVRAGTLFAQPFDPDALAITGEPVAVFEDVFFFSPTGEAGFSVSTEGTLVVRPNEGRSQLQWFERDGRPSATLFEPDFYFDLSLSRDGRRVAIERRDPRASTSDLWVADLDRNVPMRLTSSPRSELYPQLSPDGSRLAFGADWEGPPNIYVIDVGSTEPRLLVPFDRTVQVPGSWTPDGEAVVYSRPDGQNGRDIWMVDVASGERRPILATTFGESSPQVSPDGRWLAYVSNASGRAEVYLRPFPDGTSQVRLSVDGGLAPVWRNDGREVFYFGLGGSMMAVSVEPGQGGQLRAGLPQRLFSVNEKALRSFAVAPDGQRFLLNLTEPEGHDPPDHVVVDWMRLMKK